MADAIQVASLFGVLSLKDQMSDALESAKGGLANFADNLKATGAQIAELGGAMTGIAAPLAGFFGAAIKEASDWRDVIAQTDAVIESTGGAAGQTREDLINLALSFQQVTRYSDDQIVSGENLLLTFTNIGKNTFPRATKAMLDMSAAMKQDLKSSAVQLGKALNDPVNGMTALTRVGVTFTEEQKAMVAAMVEAGDVAGAQAIILAELEREFGGSAEAAGSTFAGQLDIARRSVEDIMQAIGELLIPIIQDLVEQVKPMLESIMSWVQNNPQLVQGIAMVAGAMALLGPVLLVVGGAIGAIGTILGVILSPIGLILALIGGLYLAFETNFLGIRDFLKPIIDEISNMFAALSAGVDPQSALATAIGNLFGQQAEEAFLRLTDGLKDIMAKIGDVVGKIQEWIEKNPELARTLLTGALVFGIATVATNLFGGAIGAVKTAAELLIGKGAMIWDFLHTFAGKVGLVSLAVWALITAFQELQKFLKDLDKMQAETAMAAAPLISQHGITKQQFIDQAWKSSVAELGDPAARLLWGSGIINFQARIEQMYEDALKANGGAASMGSISGFASRVYADYQSHATGLSYVPYDNYPARLHEGERVLTRDENMNGGGGFNNYGNITVIANDPQEFMSKLKAAQVRLG